MVAVWAVFAGPDFHSRMGLVVQLFHLLIELFGVWAFGIEEHDAFIPATKHVDIAEQLHFRVFNKRIFSSIMGAVES